MTSRKMEGVGNVARLVDNLSKALYWYILSQAETHPEWITTAYQNLATSF